MPMPKLIFLDGDGTIWYPKSTKRTQKPHWIYHDPSTKNQYLQHLELAPKIRETLAFLHSQGVLLVLISANPAPAEVAESELLNKLQYFGIEDYFHSYHSSPGDNPLGKAEVIQRILTQENLLPQDSLMVGDSYFYDYEAAQSIGVPAYWIENTVSNQPDVIPPEWQKISEVSDILEQINHLVEPTLKM